MPYTDDPGGGGGLGSVPGGLGFAGGGRVGGGGRRRGKERVVSETTHGIGFVSGENSTQVLSISKTASSTSIKTSDPSSVNVRNSGDIPCVVMFGYQSFAGKYDSGWSTTVVASGHASVAADTAVAGVVYMHVLLRPGESFNPPMRAFINVASSANVADNDPAADTFCDQSGFALEGTVVDFTAPDSNAYIDTDLDIDNTTGTDNIIGSATNNTLYIEQFTNTSNHGVNYFRVGDLVQVNTEIMEVTALGTGADLANTTLTVKRGLFGSTAASDHGDDAAIRLPFSNTYTDFDSTNKLRTDKNGRWWSMNSFGYGRNTNGNTFVGIEPGSFLIKFYTEGAYQEFGMSGVSSSTHSGLTASTEYKFNITVDGGSAFSNLTFTTDSSNLNFGGTNGVIPKIQDALDTQFYTAGHLFEKPITIGIVSGDIRVASLTNRSDSAILLAAPTSGTTPFGVGRIPAIGSIEGAVASDVPDNVTYNRITYAESPNDRAFASDDGYGNISGVCTGRINLETGELLLTGCPPEADFLISLVHSTPTSGKRDTGGSSVGTVGRVNSLIDVRANVLNKRKNGQVKVLVS